MAFSTLADANPKNFRFASTTAVFPTAAHAAPSATYAGSIFAAGDQVFLKGIWVHHVTTDNITLVDKDGNDITDPIVTRSSNSGPAWIDLGGAAAPGGFGAKSSGGQAFTVVFMHSK